MSSQFLSMYPCLHGRDRLEGAGHDAVVNCIWNSSCHCSLGRVVFVREARADFPSSSLLVGSRFDLHRHVARAVDFCPAQCQRMARWRQEDRRPWKLCVQDGEQQLTVQGWQSARVRLQHEFRATRNPKSSFGVQGVGVSPQCFLQVDARQSSQVVGLETKVDQLLRRLWIG